MGKKEEEPKPAQWQSVWDRSGIVAPSGTLTDDQREMFNAMQAAEAESDKESNDLRRKVTAELAEVGVCDEAMIEEVFKQQLEELKLSKLMRPQDHRQEQDLVITRRSRSRSRLSENNGSKSGSRSSS